MKKIQRVKELSDVLRQRLIEKGYATVGKVLEQSEFKLMDDLDLDLRSVRKLIQDCSRSVIPNQIPTVALFFADKTSKYLPTKISLLDKYLLGGLRAGNITELVGGPGIGKTQFCLSMAVATVTPSEDVMEEESASESTNDFTSNPVGVVYIDTEKIFFHANSIQRFVEIAKHRGISDVDNLLSHITIKSISDTDSLIHYITQDLPSIIVEQQIQLVIVDSVAALPRKEFEDIIKRQQMLSELATALKEIAFEFKIPILVTNHITVQSRPFSKTTSSEGSSSTSAVSETIAALGVTWAHCVNTRLVLEEVDLKAFKTSSAISSLRYVTIAKSPVSAAHSIAYKIGPAGFFQEEIATQQFLNKWKQYQKQQQQVQSTDSQQEVEEKSRSVFSPLANSKTGTKIIPQYHSIHMQTIQHQQQQQFNLLLNAMDQQDGLIDLDDMIQSQQSQQQESSMLQVQKRVKLK